MAVNVLKTRRLMLYKAKAAVCSENIQAECHYNLEFLNIKPGGT